MSDRPPPGDSVRVSDKSQLKWQLIEIGFQLVGGILCFTLLKRVMSHMDPMKQHKEGIQQVGGNHITCQNMRLTTELIQRTCTVLFQSKTALSKRLRRPELAKMNISEYEKMMADEVLDADEIEGGFDSIGGLEQEKRDVRVTLRFPWVCVHHVCDHNTGRSCYRSTSSWCCHSSGPTCSTSVVASWPRPRASCSMGHQALARRCSPRPSQRVSMHIRVIFTLNAPPVGRGTPLLDV